jgi:hypothetical protein
VFARGGVGIGKVAVDDHKKKKKKKKVSIGRLLNVSGSKKALRTEDEDTTPHSAPLPSINTPSPKTFSSVPSPPTKSASPVELSGRFEEDYDGDSTSAESPTLSSSDDLELLGNDDKAQASELVSTTPALSSNNSTEERASSIVSGNRRGSGEKRVTFFGLDDSNSAEDARSQVVCDEFLVSVETFQAAAASSGKAGGKVGTIFQDWLGVRMPSERVFTRKWSLVHNNALYLFNSFDSARPSSVVLLDQVVLSDSGKQTFSLTSRTGRVLYLATETPQLKVQWINLLRGGDPHLAASHRGSASDVIVGDLDFTTVLFSLVCMLNVWLEVTVESFKFVASGGKNLGQLQPRLQDRE